jgi:MOSC domain-containing protein YiiM
MDPEAGEKARARVKGVASSPRRGRKFAQKEITLVAGLGVMGDAHFGPGDRQVSLLELERARAAGIESAPGDFAENILAEGLERGKLTIGSRLRAGPCLLEVAGIGKPEWRPGDYSFGGRALLAEGGLFCRVLEGGVLREGDEIEVA